MPSARFAKGVDGPASGPTSSTPRSYDFKRCRKDLRQQGITHRIARRGIATFDELGKADIRGVARARGHIAVIEREAVTGLADIESEQMVVLEQHDGLDREVQRLEAVGKR